MKSLYIIIKKTKGFYIKNIVFSLFSYDFKDKYRKSKEKEKVENPKY